MHGLLVAGVAGVVLVAVLEGVVAHVAAHVGFGAIVELRILLAELFLRSGDQAIVVLGVLIIILGGHRVARRLRVARKLDVFLGDVRRISADLHVGSVGLENPRHRVLVLAVVVVMMLLLLIVTTAHPLVVLTVSHDLPVC